MHARRTTSRNAFSVPSNLLAVVTLTCVLGVLIFSALMSILEVVQERLLQFRLAYSESSRKLLFKPGVHGGKEVLLPALGHGRYHIFLSQ